MLLSTHIFFDPKERNLMETADKTTFKFKNIPKNEREMMVGLSLQYAKELDQFNRTA